MREDMPSMFEGEEVTDLTGKLSLSELVNFVKHADGLVAGSTGVLHLAAAQGVAALGLYSPMRPIHPGRWKPVGERADHLVLDKSCSDCSYNSLCSCIQSISVDQVVDRLDSMLTKVQGRKAEALLAS